MSDEEPSPEPEEEAEPQLETIFTYNADIQMVTDFEETWIILHDEKGNLIDYKQQVPGETLIFQAMDTLQIQELSVSKFVVLEQGFYNDYRIYTYGKFDKGKIWDEPEINSVSTTIGDFDLTVTNIENWEEYSLFNTNGHGRYMDRYFQSIAENDNDPTNLNLSNFPLDENNDYFLSIIDGDTYPKYTWIYDIENGKHLNIDGSTQLKNYETVINLPIPEDATGFSYSATAIDENKDLKLQLYNVQYSLNLNAVESIKLGYLEEYDNYETGINFSFDNYSYFYSQPKDKIKIENIKPIEPEVTFESKSSTEFSFSSLQDFIRYQAFWLVSSSNEGISYSTSWQITAQSGFFPSIIEFPKELVNKYPELSIEKLELKNTSLYLKTNTWNEYISDLFGQTKAPKVINELVTVYP